MKKFMEILDEEMANEGIEGELATKVKKGIFFIPMLILVIILFFSTSFTVQKNEFVLVKSFGRVVNVIETPGLKFKIPFVQSVEKLPNTIIPYDLPQSDVLTKDKKAMVVDNYVLWKIADPLLFVQTLSTIQEAERRIDNAVYNTMKNHIGNLEQTEVVALRGDILSDKITATVSSTLKEYGIEVVNCEIKRFDLPNENKLAVYNRMISERTQIAAIHEAEGKEEADKIRNETDSEITVILSEAKSKAAEILAQGESTYMQILAEAYEGNSRSEFYEYIRSLDALKISMQGEKTLFLPIDSPLTKILLGK